MAKVWTLVGLIAAIAVLLSLIFMIESLIHAKICEFAERHEKRQAKKRLNKLFDELDDYVAGLTIEDLEKEDIEDDENTDL